MSTLRLILIVVVLPASALPAHAQIFNRKAKTSPAQRVPELILTLKTDQSERKRSSAADELAGMDGATFPEIATVLADVAKSDSSTGMRIDALSALGRLRPVSQTAGQTIEQAASNDDSLRVRVHARTLLLRYEVAGYSSGKTPNPQTKAADEKPAVAKNTPKATTPPPAVLAKDTRTPAQSKPSLTKTTVVNSSPAKSPTTSEPPMLTPAELAAAPLLNKGLSATPMSQKSGGTALEPDATPFARPLPAGPAFTTDEPPLLSPRVVNPANEGPTLTQAAGHMPSARRN